MISQRGDLEPLLRPAVAPLPHPVGVLVEAAGGGHAGQGGLGVQQHRQFGPLDEAVGQGGRPHHSLDHRDIRGGEHGVERWVWFGHRTPPCPQRTPFVSLHTNFWNGPLRICKEITSRTAVGGVAEVRRSG